MPNGLARFWRRTGRSCPIRKLLPIGVAIVIPPDCCGGTQHDPADATVVEDAPRLVPLPTDGSDAGADRPTT